MPQDDRIDKEIYNQVVKSGTEARYASVLGLHFHKCKF